MTAEEKQLVLIDLCARLPYETIVNCLGNVLILKSISYTAKGEVFRLKSRASVSKGSSRVLGVSIIKPYLRPMSSMTKEETVEWHETTLGQRWVTFDNVERCVDWLNSHHFDFRGLIEKGLALEASKGMYKTE